MGRGGLPVLIEHPAEQTSALGRVHEHAGLAGQIAGIPMEVAAEGDPVVLFVINQERQRAEEESGHGQRQAAPRQQAPNQPRKDHRRGYRNAR